MASIFVTDFFLPTHQASKVNLFNFEPLASAFLLPEAVQLWPVCGRRTCHENGGHPSLPGVYSGVGSPFFCINSCKRPTGFKHSSGSTSLTSWEWLFDESSALIWVGAPEKECLKFLLPAYTWGSVNVLAKLFQHRWCCSMLRLFLGISRGFSTTKFNRRNFARNTLYLRFDKQS